MGIHICTFDSDTKVWEDADSSCNWFLEESKNDSDMARYHLVFVVSYLGCPVMWN